ncbi:MAG: TRAP transporter large permease [Alphaproteobacteria bacterium]|nr:TRAP transporter large permease [Alphaproteobacteria bacterium]
MSALITTFLVTLMIGVPVAFAFGLAAIAGLVTWSNVSMVILPQRMFAGVDSFPFLAIPFFILVGDLMAASGITLSLVRFCDSLVGRIRGGLAQVNVIANVVFAGISGAATADAAALGAVMIPAMVKAGYDKPFAAAVTAAAAIMGPIIPPSIGMVIYSLTLGGKVSIAGLFMAGILPGLLIALVLSILCYVMAVRRGYPVSDEGFALQRVASSFRGAAPALLAPMIILGGILGGIFTPTESAAVCVVYVLVVGLAIRRGLTTPIVLAAVERSIVTTSVVTLLLATSEIVTWLLTAMHFPAALSALVMSIAPDRVTFILVFLVFMMLAGIAVEPVPLMVMFAPILAPIAYKFGIDPLHFGVMFVLAVEIGLITPPVGSVLFVVCGVANMPLKTLSRAILPFVVAEFIALLIVAFVPAISLAIPHSLGFR